MSTHRSTPQTLSHRTRAEQLLGLGIFLSISLGIDLIHRNLETLWFQKEAPWALSYWPASFFGTVSFVLVSLSMWALWRKNSLKQLRPELSLYLSIFVMTLLWDFSFFKMKEALVGLIALLLTSSFVIFTSLLSWKKERGAAQMLLIPFGWFFYLAGLTMFICTTGVS